MTPWRRRHWVVAAPGGGEPARVTVLPNTTSAGVSSFVAGRGVVLWTAGETRLDPLTLVEHFVMLNQNTGCVQELPNTELSIGQALLDAHHVYWKSFNALGSVTEGQPIPPADLLRVDPRTGRFALYIRRNPEPGLFAVRKPD